MQYDALVIGAGPIGSNIAGILSEKGHSVLLLEEHRTIGLPMQCGGLISPRIRGLVDFPIPTLNTVRGAFIIGPDGNEFQIHSHEDKGLVVDRTGFDMEAAKWAVSRGADLKLGKRVTNITIDTREVNAETSDGHSWSAKLVIGAEGPASPTARAAGLPPIREFVTGYEMESVGLPRNINMVEVFAGERIGKGFFGWVIPVSEDRIRIGCGVHRSSYSALESFRYLVAESICRKRFRDIQPLSIHSGAIPIGVRDRVFSRRSMVVGDAAGLAKPISGGGIITGLISGRFAAEVADDALRKNDFSASALTPYQLKIKEALGKELSRAWRLRKAFMSLPDHELNNLFGILSIPQVMKIINDKGDIDYPGRLAMELIRTSPRLLAYSLKYLGRSLFS